MSREVLYARPSDLVTAGATLSLTAGSAAGAFPLANLKDGKARTVFKSTGTGATIRSVWGGAVTLEGLVLAYHKLAGAAVTVTNGAGFNQAFAIPANSADGHGLDPWADWRGLANRTSTTWDIAITGAATVVAIGELLWVQTWRELLLDRGAGDDDVQPALVQPTDYHPQANVYSMGTRVRLFRGSTPEQGTADDLRLLHREMRGPKAPCVLVPDAGVNDALYVQLTSVAHQLVEDGARGNGMRSTAIEFIEMQKGLAL